VDEIAWDSNPPSPQKKVAVSLSTQARWVEQAEYMLWRQGVSTMMWLQLRDYTTSNYTFSWSGMYFNDGTPKPSLTALRFPLVAQRLSRGRVRVWGRSPAAGALSVSAGGKVIKRLNVKALDVFQFNVGLRGRAVLKASVAGQSSLPWTQS
jgi:hypothetical protein